MKIAIIGAGISGLICAYRLADDFEVSVFEKKNYEGGLCSNNYMDESSLDKYNHFFSRRDIEIIKVIDELGLKDDLSWKKVRQASIIENEFVDMSRPLSLFSLPGVTIIEKIRLAVFLLGASMSKSGIKFNKDLASSWVESHSSLNVFERYFKPMLEFKFQNYDDISASYLWARINESKQNEIGVLNGGMHTLLTALIDKIQSRKAEINLGREIKRIEKTANDKWLLHDCKTSMEFDCVICCTSLVEFTQLCDKSLLQSLNIPKADYLHAGSYVLKLKKPLKDGYWLFINQKDCGKSSVIVDTSFVNGYNIVYCPVYRRTNIISANDQKMIFSDCLCALKNIDRDFEEDWIEAKSFHQDAFVEPVFTKKFIEQVLAWKSPSNGFYLPDAMYESHLLKTVNTQALKAKLIVKKIMERNSL